MTSYIGGALDSAAVNLTDDQLMDIAASDLQRVTGVALTPDFTHVHRHVRAIPQTTVGHLHRIEQIENEIRKLPGLFLAGNYLSGVSINDAAANGMAAADRSIQFLTKT